MLSLHLLHAVTCTYKLSYINVYSRFIPYYDPFRLSSASQIILNIILKHVTLPGKFFFNFCPNLEYRKQQQTAASCATAAAKAQPLTADTPPFFFLPFLHFRCKDRSQSSEGLMMISYVILVHLATSPRAIALGVVFRRGCPKFSPKVSLTLGSISPFFLLNEGNCQVQK